MKVPILQFYAAAHVQRNFILVEFIFSYERLWSI